MSLYVSFCRLNLGKNLNKSLSYNTTIYLKSIAGRNITNIEILLSVWYLESTGYIHRHFILKLTYLTI